MPTHFPLPDRIAYPNAQNAKGRHRQADYLFHAICPAFLLRVAPASNRTNPACMKMTNTAHNMTQSASTIRSISLNWTTHHVNLYNTKAIVFFVFYHVDVIKTIFMSTFLT
jgi:hypothetical protein